jgi:hypothetical protein
MSGDAPLPPTNSSVTIRKTEFINVQRTATSGGRFKITGTSSGLTENGRKLLMFITSTDVVVPHWFLQLPPSGLNELHADGTWLAVGQIGNREYPPHRSQRISVLMLAAPTADADRFIQSRIEDPALQNVGIPSGDLPQVERQWSARIDDLPLRFVPRRW